jgi:hypothetical protein
MERETISNVIWNEAELISVGFVDRQRLSCASEENWRDGKQQEALLWRNWAFAEL